MKRIALLGAGAIAEVHLEAARQIPGAAITWVVDIDRAKADRLAAKAGARSTSDPAEAVGSEDTDAVIVAVPTPAHRAMVELAASFGKDILCEKPLARTRDDADAIVAACDAAGVRLMTGQVVRHFPEYQRIHAALQENAIGKPGLVRASRVGPSPGPGRAWFNDSAASGGVALDMMVHEFDLLRWWFGDASRIYASGLAAAQPDADYAQAVVRFASGVIAHVEASWAHAAFRTTIEVAGERGILRHDSDLTNPLRMDMKAIDASGPRVSFRKADSAEPWRTQLAHFVDRLEDGAPFLVSGHDGARAVDMALAALDSIASGQPVTFMAGRSQGTGGTV